MAAKRCNLFYLLLTGFLASCQTIDSSPPAPIPGFAQGSVFLDEDRNGVKGPREPGIAEVAVSNGHEVVLTDAAGRYQIPAAEDMTIFVVQPKGYRVPTDENGLPRFYYVHRPNGSPQGLNFPGIAPTGALPSQLNFALLSGSKQDRFSVLLLGDTQIRNAQELAYLQQDIVAPLTDSPATLAIALGDLVYDDLSLLEPLINTIGTIGAPWWPVIGNHDINFRAKNDALSAETWGRLFGPTNYAFQVGQVHFIVLDSFIYAGWNHADNAPGTYREGFGSDEIQFLKAYLDTVPNDELVVVAMHVPLGLPGGRHSLGAKKMLALLSGHAHTLSISAHAHRQFQLFLGSEEGFTGTEPHHHLNVGATSGSWWGGAFDESGIPHTTMRDGAPNGYWIAHFEGQHYQLEFRPSRRPSTHQINIFAPSLIDADTTGSTEILANVFAGSERTQVQLQIDQETWQPMKKVSRPDPYYEALVHRESLAPPSNRRPLPNPARSSHLWSTHLPEQLKPGIHILSVRAIDPYFGTIKERHLINVKEP